MTRYGLDYESLPVAEVKRLGASFVCRYLSTDPAKNLTPHEAKELSAHDIDIVVVWETAADRALDGRDAGERDAHEALVQAIWCGMVGSRPIFFAVDFEATSPALLNPYFDGVRAVLGYQRTGVYGGIGAVGHLLDARLAGWAWQTYAWSGGRWDDRARLRQYLNGQSYDHDLATAQDFGQWRYHVRPPETRTSPLAPLQPSERAEVDRFEHLLRHPHLHPEAVKTVRARLVELRKNVWRAAELGVLPDGKRTMAGWGIDHRKARYEILLSRTR
jgi:Rv2525c-like, glycoside hydrolase-like domain